MFPKNEYKSETLKIGLWQPIWMDVSFKVQVAEIWITGASSLFKQTTPYSLDTAMEPLRMLEFYSGIGGMVQLQRNSTTHIPLMDLFQSIDYSTLQQLLPSGTSK